MQFIIALITILLLSREQIAAQRIHRKCGPAIYLSTRYPVQNDSLNYQPYDAIVHVFMKGWGSASFINDSTLITAKHVADKNRLHNMTVYKNTFRNGLVETREVKLESTDFKVLNLPADDCHFISSDISYIILLATGKAKLRGLYTNHFEIADYRDLQLDPGDTVVVSGYPVDQAEKGINQTDILSSKKTSFGELLFDKECTMLGYKLFCCSGDSGAPLWVSKEGKFYIIAIHHGGPERGTVFTAEQRNSAAIITTGKLIYK